jgi:hypothetical protein
MSKIKTIKAATYRGYPIIVSKGEPLECRTDIQDKVIDLTEQQVREHRRVFWERWDLRFPESRQYPYANKIIEGFTDSLNAFLKRENCDSAYLRKREQETSLNPHEHFLYLHSGDATRSHVKHLNKATELLAGRLDINADDAKGLIHYAGSGMIERNSPEFIQQKADCIRAGSYLAKTVSNPPPKGIRLFNSSRLSKTPN